MRLTIATFLIAFLFSSVALAQTEPSGTLDPITTERDLFLEAANAAAARAAELQQQVDELTVNDPSAVQVIDQYNQAQIDHYKYEQDLREHAVAVLEWQLTAGWLILFLVMGVASLGIFLSYQEVIGGLRKSKKDDELIKNQELQAALANASASEKTELILSLQKVQVTSAVTGVVILVLSLGFLYLFVDRVFSLNPTNLSESDTRTTAVSEETSDDESEVETEE
ncbi:hypothetical protein MWU60_19375 [Yoonia sp. F2084L]|uniref:hypothetical protein n=1 Tax=Yoonia sp. F2084L TaxID=2926419 RepID=UPI001FF477A9|nr:hypothetical protein [Yoonia sp. F2084L]MCK0097743.1 hypothetical protein [Yoonia sp. F2084L]